MYQLSLLQVLALALMVLTPFEAQASYVPELSTGTFVSGITLLIGGVLLFLDWRRRH